ncbi:MAG: RagB/SusD family nutrient uptake outer membrane protein [Reichenbachiella sp.]
MKIKKYFIAIITSVLVFGCSDEFLERNPLDEIVSTNFYQTERDAQEALVAVYDVLGYQSSPGVSWCPIISVSDMLSDDSFAGGGDANDGANQDELNTFTIPTSNAIVHSLWIKNYIGIYRANLYLEIIDLIDASDEFKARTIAEAKFLRAYFNFEQVRFFENIPLLTNTLSGPSEYSQEQNTPKEVYDQIALDLVEAIDDLPDWAVLDGDDRGRATSEAAKSLLGRVYLFYNGVYGADLVAGDVTIGNAQVLSYLEEVINDSGHDLLADYSQIFRLASEFSIESVFEISYGDAPIWWDWGYVRGGNGNLSAQQQGPRVESGSLNWTRGWSFATVSESLVTAMAGDPRLDATVLFEGELDGVLAYGYQHTGYYSQKYTSDNEHYGASGQFELNRTANHRVIRFSDVLLMAAELGSPNAQNYLDRVRGRVGLGSIPATPDNIYNERRLELALEGLRYHDLLRKGLTFAEGELTESGIRGSDYIGDQSLFDVTFDASTKGFFPIPQEQIDLSGGVLIQNAGY